MKKRLINKIYIFLFFFIVLILLTFSNTLYVKADLIIYSEQYYILYAKSQNLQTTNIMENIFYLQRALETPFAPVVQALCRINTQEQYIRYKYLFKMHCNFLIMRSYIQLASRYDKEDIYFYNYYYKELIIESLKYAKYYYELALPYWEEAKKEALNASRFQNYKIELDTWEDEHAKIISGYYKYDEIIYQRLENLLRNLAFLENWANSFYGDTQDSSNSENTGQ